ncbi:hypothetical protein J056_003214 [Wallemia ichthyophaga EXF-994]|uniref:Uncharacterized protein n=1 Tax=Wallemia ichthyophaga (strain EXF-994 / CBS 113033) TaxID=1299270 RepID=R9A9G3_WALI9|nr:uncharacterized protein J056_003214 [Wallemia ichthyophaga EXF-994]EOQ98694.1 hypothetical protein J056_003214 [Wallemia ichthyophaga EXF-994]
MTYKRYPSDFRIFFRPGATTQQFPNIYERLEKSNAVTSYQDEPSCRWIILHVSEAML